MSNMAHLNITTLPAFAVSKLTYKGVLNEKNIEDFLLKLSQTVGGELDNK